MQEVHLARHKPGQVPVALCRPNAKAASRTSNALPMTYCIAIQLRTMTAAA
jgi:hypothetical protein